MISIAVCSKTFLFLADSESYYLVNFDVYTGKEAALCFVLACIGGRNVEHALKSVGLSHLSS